MMAQQHQEAAQTGADQIGGSEARRGFGHGARAAAGAGAHGAADPGNPDGLLDQLVAVVLAHRDQGELGAAAAAAGGDLAVHHAVGIGMELPAEKTGALRLALGRALAPVGLVGLGRRQARVLRRCLRTESGHQLPDLCLERGDPGGGPGQLAVALGERRD